MAKGGTRRGSGRPKGARNKVTADIKALAQKHGPKAIDALAEIAFETKPWLKAKCPQCEHDFVVEMERSDQTRTVAVKELLDRGYGKSPQPMTGGDGEGPAIVRIEHVIIHSANPDG